MKLLDKLGSFFNLKISATNRLVTLFLNSNAMAPKDSREFDLAIEGYNQTVIVYACVREIAVAFSGIKWGLFRMRNGQKEEIEEHPLKVLWSRPNPWQGNCSFLLSVASHYCIAGNAYIEAAQDSGGVPQYLYSLRPDRMSVIPDAIERIGGYRYAVGGQKHEFLDGEILHFKDFHPTNDWYGLSPVAVAALSIDSFKAQQRWNKGLMENSARPSGIISIEEDMEPEEVESLREKFMRKFAGTENSNVPLIMEGGKMEWKQMGMNAKELDFIQSQNLSALQIAQVYNVPPELIGLHPATYQNRREARKALYTEVVLPMLDRFRDDLNNWLPSKFGTEDIFFEPDLDDVEALQEDREKYWTRLDASEELTLNEKRLAKGYDEHDDGDVIFISSSKIPLGDAIDPLPMEDVDEDNEEDNEEDENPESNPFEDVDEDDEEEVSGSYRDRRRRDKTVGEYKQSRVRRREMLAIGRMRKRFIRKTQKAISSLFKIEERLVLEAFDRFGLDALPNIEEVINEDALAFEQVLKKQRMETMTAFGKRAVNNFKKANTDIEIKAAPEDVFQTQIRLASSLHVAEAITNVGTATKNKVRKIIGKAVAEGLPVDEIRDQIEGAYKGFKGSRAKTIALTETVTAQNRGSLEAMNSLDIPTLKVWSWSQVERVAHAEADGQAVQKGAMFIVDGEELLHPGDPNASAGNRINCQCGLTYIRDRGQ